MATSHHFLLRFLPALLFIPVWITIAAREQLLADAFGTYFPLSIAMVFGSLIAGSTPLGGGIVAFPVSVLAIKFAPSQGRDFSLLIQSCGMTAASYLVMLTRPTVLRDHGVLIAKTSFFNVLGLVIGTFTKIPPFPVMCTYTTSVVCFAITLLYIETRLLKLRAKSPELQQQETGRQSDSSGEISPDGDEENNELEKEKNEEIVTQDKKVEHAESPDMLDLMFVAIFGLAGGFISSQIGTGSDMTVYAYGQLVHNFRHSKPVADNDWTAVSIVVMTITSIWGTILRVSTTGEAAFTTEVYLAFMACSCIVVFGAPLGSLFLTEKNQKILKGLFYFFSFLQLLMFGILKIKANFKAWGAVAASVVVVVAGIAVFDSFVRRQQVASKV